MTGTSLTGRIQLQQQAVRRVRVYKTLRTAHLERAVTLGPAEILYLESRYDFDGALAQRVAPRQAGDLRAALRVAWRGYDEIEINEPAAIDCVRRAAAVVLAARVRGFLTRRQPVIATYAIGNIDPFALPRPTARRAALGRRLDLLLAPWVWRRCDRVVFGTTTARDLYADVLPPLRDRAGSTLIPAVSARCDCLVEIRSSREPQLLFVGDLSPRKGFDAVLTAWAVVREAVPEARLTVLGRGVLAPAAEAVGRSDARVEVRIDPPRAAIHEALRHASVVLLPSRRHGTWREQVGLPIVEALAHGCTVVTTDETGIAEWLAAHGHTVVPEPDLDDMLADRVITTLVDPVDATMVLASLPARDGRLAADDWMFGPQEQPA